MSKRKRRNLTAAERKAKKERNKEYMTIFVGGKQKRVKRPPTIDGMDVEEFIRRNADPLWYHLNESWEDIPVEPKQTSGEDQEPCSHSPDDTDRDLPF